MRTKLTQNHEFQTAGGGRGKLRGSPKSLGLNSKATTEQLTAYPAVPQSSVTDVTSDDA